MFGRIQNQKSVAKSGGKDANPISKINKWNGLTAEYLLIRKEFSCILRTCTGDFVLRCKHFASNWCEQAGGESSVQVGERLREHGCTGKMERNSIRGVSNSIKSEIWRFFSLSPFCFPFVVHSAFRSGVCSLVVFQVRGVGLGVCWFPWVSTIEPYLLYRHITTRFGIGCMICVLWGLFWPWREFRGSDEGFIILWNWSDSRGFLRGFVWEWVKESPGCVSRRFRGE